MLWLLTPPHSGQVIAGSRRRVLTRQVFDVVTVEALDRQGLRWVVKGRAIESVGVGDLLYLDIASPIDSRCLRFEVIWRRSYGYELEGLAKMMTGELIIQGAGGDLICPDDRLYAR
jgi:hypothetical protein